MWRRAEVIRASDSPDVAVLRVSGSVGNCYPIRETVAVAGETIAFTGFPRGGPVSHRTGKAESANSIRLQGQVYEGDSGGPVMVDGQVVGMEWGFSEVGKAHMTSCVDLLAFLRRCGVQPKCGKPIVPPSPPIDLSAILAELASLRQEVASLKLQRGERGETGERGDTGATGARGSTGGRGEIGLTGPDGPTGPEGKQGKEGPAGSPELGFWFEMRDIKGEIYYKWIVTTRMTAALSDEDRRKSTLRINQKAVVVKGADRN